MDAIPESHRDLFDLPAVWHVASIGPDGSPHVSPVWATYDGTYVRFPHAEGRQKWRNLCADDRVALSAVDPSNDERYLEVRGRVIAWEREGALELLDEMADKYRGENEFPRENAEPLEKRCTAVIEPYHCTSMG
ncbi:MAG TPA: PPOX class F420-dependent oxidoreductase [Acidimicrobiaceae bacterium]|nr:PPOX class F420-dependent oxidoreductase [Acidimicrobiaceae bacterium]HCV33456.1 PPOX class F420-dependent oxidoreductase [Acidimicrobiaceae bacterium]|tara:strand:- start:77 stop:478 length:402 start_codon:yes stop_codon:yes gene_type:complete